METVAKEYIEELIEKHIPVAFLNSESLERIMDVIFTQDTVGRKEILTVAYIIGANAKESNELLCLLGFAPLYVKRREDAIWKFFLDRHTDSSFVMNEIFLQNVDE